MINNQQRQCTYSTISPQALLAELIPSYAIDSPLECLFWQRGANDTYFIRCAGARYALRIYRHGVYPLEAIEFEAQALIYLHEQGVPVAYPVELKSGGYVGEITAPEGVRYVLMSTFAPGDLPDYEQPEHCRRVGTSVAEMHKASEGFCPRLKRASLDLEYLLDDSLGVICSVFSSRADDLDVIKVFASEVRADVSAISQDAMDWGLCHGDLHGTNLHIDNDKVTHFDFEECALGVRAYDLATFKWGECLGEQRLHRWSTFLEGYESVRPLGDADRAAIDLFVVIREFSNVAYGLRNVHDFGHALCSDREFDVMTGELRHLMKMSGKAGNTVPVPSHIQLQP